MVEDISKLETLNVGIVGHIDHGKTTLLQRLTGKFADTHSEELKRGITIKLGYADTIIEQNNKKRFVTFVDAPGHEMLMATMLSGAAIMDAAILVIAANEGIKPQTREHLVALKAKNISQIIIVQNKIDLVSKEEALENYRKIKEFIKGTIAENSVIIPISAQQNVNIEKVSDALLNLKIPERNLKDKPIFIIARSFDINRPGKKASELGGGVLGGAIKQGILKVGDEIEIKPGLSRKKENQIIYETIKTKILSMKRGKYDIKQAAPGGSLAIETELDPTLTKADSLSGCIAGKIGEVPDIDSVVNVKFNLFGEVLGLKQKLKVEDLKASENLLLSVNTSITVGMVKRIKGNEAEIHLRIPIVLFKGDNVGIARNVDGHWRLIGWGEIV